MFLQLRYFCDTGERFHVEPKFEPVSSTKGVRAKHYDRILLPRSKIINRDWLTPNFRHLQEEIQPFLPGIGFAHDDFPDVVTT